MNRIILIALLLLLSAASSLAREYTFGSFGCTVDIPEGWDIDSALADEIVLYDPNDQLIEILIKKYPLDKNYQIQNEQELVDAITGLYSEFGVEVEEISELNYLLKEDRALFRVEFVEENLQHGQLIRKYIEGIIVREEGKGQILYLLSAFAPLSAYDRVSKSARQVFDSFTITVPLAESFFPHQSNLALIMLFVVFVLMAFFYVRNRKIQSSRHPLGRKSANHWRCESCGLVNHIDSHTCNRCGAENLTQYTP